MPASAYPEHKNSIERDIIAELKQKLPSVAINGTTKLNKDLNKKEFTSSVDDERLDTVSDNMSHMSLEGENTVHLGFAINM